MERPCELCGAVDPPELLLHSPRLDGPLARCRSCGLIFVAVRRHDFTFATGADPGRSRALAQQVAGLGIVRREVEQAEAPWRRAVDRERLRRLRHFAGGAGRLLDIGCSDGDFLELAAAHFDEVKGVEADPGTAARARERGLDVVTGTLELLGGEFDVVTMFHVIEHLDSPRRALERIRSLLKPGGVLMIEAPAVDCWWFRLAPGRWRQLIPDHYWFFSRATLEQMMIVCGFRPVEYAKVGRDVSLRFAADRLRRAHLPGGWAAPHLVHALHLDEATVRLNPGDIMSEIALATGSGAPGR